MILKNLFIVLSAGAFFSGCATGPDLNHVSSLNVYPDNRVGYSLLSTGNSTVRVWSVGQTILALRFGDRIINAKDLETIDIKEIRGDYAKMHVEVRLKSKETLVANIAGWGLPVYSDLIVEWLACNSGKQCKDLFLTSGSRKFEAPPNFLASFDEGMFSELIRTGAKIEKYLNYASDRALPRYPGNYRLNFTDVSQAMNISEGLNSARSKKEKHDKCNYEAQLARDRSIKLTEEKIIATTPRADVQRALAQWRANLGNKTGDLVGWEAGCTSQF